ncbi:MAG: permease [Fusicatenibacter saccharivorans]|nr:permease [Fusicatenibacter saccharivorans]
MAEILTNNAMFSSFMIVLIVFALGDIVGKITKGKLSGMMVVMLLFLVGFLTKLIPADIIDQGGLTALSKLAIAMVLFNMGTTLNVKQLIEEWRTVLMAALCMLASCLVMLLVSPIIGFDTMLVGMPVINGAAMATSLMASAAAEKGLATAAALCAVIYSVQKFVGAPIASAMGIRYGKKLLKAYRENPAQFKKQETGNGASAKIFFADKHKEWYSANVMMALVAAGSWVAHILGDLTPINYSIWALLLGVVCAASGLVPTKPLQKSNSYGLMMVAVFGSIIPSLAKVSLSDLGTMAFQTIVLFAAAPIGVALVGWVLPTWKLVGDKDLAVGIGVEQFLGFPSNVVICREVGDAVGETPEEKAFIEDTLNVPYVVGGITVITVLSTMLAGFVINML